MINLLESYLTKMYPMKESIDRRILILFFNLLHISIWLFIVLGIFLIPIGKNKISLVYIYTIIIIILLLFILKKCLCEIIKDKLHYSEYKNTFIPIRKKYLITLWIILLIIAILKYFL